MRKQKVPRHLVAQPAARHTRRHLQQIGHDALVEPAETFLADDDGDGIPDGLVLVADAGHAIYLEATAEDIAVGGASALVM